MWSVVALALVASTTWLTMRVIAASPGFSQSGESVLSEVALLGAVALFASPGIVHRQDRVAALGGHMEVTRDNRTSRVDLVLPVVDLAAPYAASINGAGT